MRCEHCTGEINGYASVGISRLCHPDFGLDCYKLVTLYGHEFSCNNCRDVRIVLDAQQRLKSSLKEWPKSSGLLGNDS